MSIFIICLGILMLVIGFILGVTYSAYVMTCKAEKNRMELEETAEGRKLVWKHQAAIAFATQCWCDPRTMNTSMDTDLAMVFAETLSKYIDALQWCSAADDFQHGGAGVPNGKACVGFDRICRPLMSPDGLIDVTRLSTKTYGKLRKNCPELLGLGKRSENG